MNNTVITQVDESTKRLMEEIQDGISSSIEDGIRDVGQEIESVEGKTDLILSKFKNFDGLNSSAEQLRSLAEESKKITGFVSPLQSGMAEQSEIIKQLKKSIAELGEKQVADSSKIKAELNNFQQASNEQFASLTESIEKLQATLDIIVNLVTPFWKKWI